MRVACADKYSRTDNSQQSTSMENNGENVTFESGALSKTSEHDHCLPKDTILNGKTDGKNET